ncbi:MAG TPA: amidase, partial [Candidatus Aquilonibacter sp.]|nr:amidase [Candidatus Aquilonibacter sp.]
MPAHTSTKKSQKRSGKTRREFLAETSAGLLGAAALGASAATAAGATKVSGVGAATAAAAPLQDQRTVPITPGAPTTFGANPPVGPEVSAETFLEAQKLVRVEMEAKDIQQAVGSWRLSMAGLYERRTGPRKLEIESTIAPATRWDPMLPGIHTMPARDGFVRSETDPGPLPAKDEDIAFAPVTKLSRWVERRELTSERLTNIYLDRIARYDSRLRCVITLTRDLALQQAKAADAEIAAGKYRGPLHGIPWGGKDLLDTAGIRTTWGAEIFEHRVPEKDAAVVKRLHEAGAVMLAKLSLGALASNDIWFGGQTMNPWLLEEGSSGSSAGPGAATAAALVGFSIGSETGGSIIAPTMRCGLTGLRPTFGRVPRTGAMTL